MSVIAELTREAAEQAVGDAVELWDARCHEVSVALAPLVGGVVRRGYFLGRTVEGAHFNGMLSQHSWIELPDGRVCDPTRHAFDLSPRWPLWIGDGAEYDIGGCRTQEPFGRPDEDARIDGPLVTLRLSDAALACTGLEMCLRSWQVDNDADPLIVRLSKAQTFWLGNLPVKDSYMLGAIPRQHAREIYQALVDANWGEAIPIDRRDWILEDGGSLYGRPA